MKVIQFKTQDEKRRESCIKHLESTLRKVRERDLTGVAVVTTEAEGGLGTSYQTDDVVTLLGGLTRLIADINKDMDEKEG